MSLGLFEQCGKVAIITGTSRGNGLEPRYYSPELLI